MGRRGIPGRSETGQKHVRNKGWMQDSAHPSIHRPYRLICRKAGSSYCIGKKEDRVEPLHVCFPCVTGLISWETPALLLGAVRGFSQLHQDCRLARATEGLTVWDVFAARKLDNNFPSCHTLFLFLQRRFPFVFSFDGSKRHARKVRNRSETCQKQRWMQDSAHPSIHPSIWFSD